ncbi:MAG: FAD-binding protein, partial [Isosphaeraceae bacterium]
MRAGLGQVGVIAKATLKLVAAPESVHRFLLVYPDLATMLRDERLLSADNRFDAVQGTIVAAPGGGIAFRLDAAKNFNWDRRTTTSYSPACPTTRPSGSPRRSSSSITSTGPPRSRRRCARTGSGSSRTPWLMTFIADSQVESVVNAELDAL